MQDTDEESREGPTAGETDAPDGALLVELFGELLEVDQAERDRRLEDLRGSRPEVAEELAALLVYHEQSRDLLEPPTGPQLVPPGWQAGRIQGFEIVDEIGLGATGVVYRAIQEGIRRDVALKVLRWDSRDRRTVRRFEREGRLLGKLNHRHLAEIYAVGVEDFGGRALPWISMELIDGVAFDVAARGESWRTIVARMADAAGAVAVAHAAGVVHRDLKPANVLVQADGRTVVLDFGIARSLSSDEPHSLRTASGQVLGTLAYMAPEQAAGDLERIGPATDVHALGAMLFEATTGRTPLELEGLETTSALRRIERGDHPRLRTVRPELPRDLELVVERALDPDPARRYANCGDLESDLRRLLNDAPVVARPVGLPHRARLFVRRNQTVVAATGMVLLTLLAGLLVSLRALGAARDAESDAERSRDLVLALDLERQAQSLWPAEPQRLADLRLWLAEAEGLRERLGTDLAGFVPSGRAPGTDERDARAPTAIAADLFDPQREHGGFVDVSARLRRAERVEQETLVDVAADWDAAIERVRRDTRFEGLEFEPQLGLLPLGPDPDSGFEEFALWGPIGRVPERGVDGRLELPPDATLVFVLLPGGVCRVGAQSVDPGLPRYDPDAQDSHEWLGVDALFDLDPFLCSKYETTHHQFRRAMGFDPSFWQPGEFELPERVPISARGPVETVPQPMASSFCRQLALDLPTGVQHEYATRGGTETALWSGPDRASVRGRIAVSEPGLEVPYTLDDGTPAVWYGNWFPAPTGIHAANPFGLHDMIGGIREWCREVFWVQRDFDAMDPRTGDWKRVEHDPFGDHFPLRGCGFGRQPYASMRSSFRPDTLGRAASNNIGFRAVKPLVGAWTRHARPLDAPRRTQRTSESEERR